LIFWWAVVVRWAAKKSLQAFHQLHDPWICDSIVNKVGIFAAGDDFLVAEDGQVLGNIAIGRLDGCLEITDGHLLFPEQAEYFQADGVGHGLEETGNVVNFCSMHNFPVAVV
jgi:hypothetical protein